MDSSNSFYDDSLLVSVQRIERNKLLNETDKYLMIDLLNAKPVVNPGIDILICCN